MTHILDNTHAHALHMQVAYVKYVTSVCNLDSGHGSDV